MSAPTQSERVLAFVKANPGCTTMELQLALEPFVSNPRARVSDLRAAGIDVVCQRRADGRLGYHVAVKARVTTGVQEGLAL